MDDRVEAFEIEPSYSEDPFARGPRVLWGRVAALGGGLILFFLIGHWTGGGGGSSQQVTTLQRQVDQDRTTIQQLQQSLAAVSQAPSTSPTAATSPGAGSTPGGATNPGAATNPDTSSTPTPAATAPATSSNGQTYRVKVGDTVGGIAARFYGRTNHDLVALIEQANGMVDTNIHPGQTLTIPPAPKASPTASTPATPRATVTPRASASPAR
ncbi:MAG: LysM peptidoglycan-binding domain-containing protein [Candidatus Dormibacteria bacterium]